MALRTVPNFGLFEGIANGVNQGLLTYQNQKNIQHQRQMEGLMNGVQTDDRGNPTGEFAPWRQAQMDTQGLLAKSQIAQAQQQQRENDPTDSMAQSIHDVYKKQGIDTGMGLGYKQQKDVGEGMAVAKLRAQLAGANKNLITGKDWTKFGDDIDPTKSRQGSLAKANDLLNSTKRIDAIFEQFPDGNIPKAQQAELANATAALYGGGSAQSQHQINAIVPSSLWGDTKGIESYLLNMPVGQDQGEFVKIMRESSDREKKVAAQLIHEGVAEKAGKYENLSQSDRPRFLRMLHDRGVNEDEIDSYGHYAPKQPAQPGLMPPSSPTSPSDAERSKKEARRQELLRKAQGNN